MSALTSSFVGLFVATLFLGHQVSRTPIKQLGQRPMGRELWGWLLHFTFDGVGIWGYDNSLGCWSPPIRLLLHGSFAGILYSLFGGVPAVVVYPSFCVYYHHMVPNVSHPGGVRAHKIQRVPQFPDAVTTLDDQDVKLWRSVVAQESHKVSELKFEGAAQLLTGEPVGRQTWTTTTQQQETTQGKRVDEKLVQELAAGGRSPGSFNPAKNPNRCVLYELISTIYFNDIIYLILLALHVMFVSVQQNSPKVLCQFSVAT